MGLWRGDDITLNILFRRKKKIWRKQITTAEIKKKEGQEEEEKEEKEKERKKNLGSHLLSIPSVAWYVCKKFRVEGPWMLRCMCVHMHVWKYVCHCAYMDIRGCLGRHYMTQRVSHTASKTQCVD